MRRTTVNEAHALGYGTDDDCVQTGAYFEEGRSLSGILLERIGIFPRKQYWWDRPFRTEDGVVYPGKPGAKVRAAVLPDGTPELCYDSRANGGRPLTLEQLDLCGHFATLHLKASRTTPTGTTDQSIDRSNTVEVACSASTSTPKNEDSRPIPNRDVTNCVMSRELARLRASNTPPRNKQLNKTT